MAGNAYEVIARIVLEITGQGGTSKMFHVKHFLNFGKKAANLAVFCYTVAQELRWGHDYY
jgi:hypothetical protein